ncbi:MAG: ATP synthase F1 subunit epsilon [bacterium]
MSKIHLKVVSPERTLVDNEIEEVIVWTKTGQIAILPNHMPLVTEIEPGDIIIKTGKEDIIAVIYGGFIQVKEKSEVLILADGAEHLHELNEAEIKEAKERAEQAKKQSKGNKVIFAASEAELARITTQLRSITRHSGIRRRHGKDIKELKH